MAHDNWQTPPELFAVVNDEFLFDLDAAASADNALCRHFITEQQDALIHPWDADVVWINPPYTRLPAFVQRAYEQSVEFQNTVCLLIPTYTDPRYWKTFVARAHEIRDLVGRLQFLEDGKKKQSARFPSSLIVFKWIKGEHFGKSPNRWSWDWRK